MAMQRDKREAIVSDGPVLYSDDLCRHVVNLEALKRRLAADHGQEQRAGAARGNKLQSQCI
jgi:hypothetical protein